MAACGPGRGTDPSTKYFDGPGSTVIIRASDRRPPIALAGVSLDGKRIDVTDWRGRVVVINVWASWCPPCRTETPAIVQASRQAGPEVAFLGLNIRDQATAARAFVRAHKLPYPSIEDPDGDSLLALGAVVTPNSLPSTVVLDERGRVAAIVLGQSTASLLTDLIDEVAA